MKKKLSLILALITIASTLIACGSDGDGAETTIADNQAETTAPETTLYMPDDLPNTLDYNGAEVHTLGWSDATITEFEVEEQDGDIVNDSIYTRNNTVEERLNVDLTYNLIPGNNGHYKEWIASVTNSVLAGDGANDIIAGYSWSAPTLAANGMLLDMTELEHIDFDKPWWPASLTDEAICGGKLYFASGDISTNLIINMNGVFFNKGLADSYGITGMYDLVRDGTWTFDKLMELTAPVYSDINGDGVKDGGDLYGFMLHTIYTDTLYFAAGLRTTEEGDDGLPMISEDYKGEKTQALLEKLIDMFAHESWYLCTNGDELRAMFVEERALFHLKELNLAASTLRESEIEYGILPVPKGSESQDDYSACTSFTYTLYGVPIDNADTEMTSAVLECLASEGYRTVSPALFETALKVKYSSDDDASEMYDIIRATVSFDFGRIFCNALNNLTWGMFRYSLADGDANWFSKYESNKGKLEGMFDTLIESLSD